MQIGVFSPIAVLPAHLMDRLDDQTFRAVAVHELAHVRRWDYLLHLLAMVVLAFHWFNPLAWLAVRRLHETSEYACDEWAVRLIGKYEVYARALLDVLGDMRGQRVRWGLGMAYQAEERLERIMKMKNAIPVDVGRWAGGMVLASVAVGALILGCSTALTSKQSVLPGGSKSAYDGSDLDKAENCAAQQKWDEAKKAYKEVLSKDSTLVRANLMIGRISYRQGAYDEAVRYLSKVPADVCWAALTLGWSYDAIGERERAIEAYKRTLQLDPQESIATAARLGLAAPHSPRKRVKRDEGFKDVELPTVGWKAIADPNPEDAGKAFDRDPKTRWASKVPQSPGMSFQVDLGSIRVIDRVLLNDDADGTTIYVSDYPRGYTIEVSPDGKKWQMVASEDGDVNSYAGAFFEPMEAQYVRVIQKGSVEPEWWSIYEFVVFAPAP